jgi:hypothetical protein
MFNSSSSSLPITAELLGLSDIKVVDVQTKLPDRKLLSRLRVYANLFLVVCVAKQRRVTAQVGD